MTALSAPSKWLTAAELPRAFIGLSTLPRATRMLEAAPQGDGRPVMVLPGLTNSDRSNYILRRYLIGLGYRAEGWGLGRNLGVKTVGLECDKLFDRIRALHVETGEPVTLIGVSLGGMMARLAAQRLPDLVREVITISSPFAGDPKATAVWRVFEMLTGQRIDDDQLMAQHAEMAAPLPGPATAIWSRTDGMVNGMICHAPDDPTCCDVEIRSSHLLVQLRPEVLRTIADVLGGLVPQGSA